MKQVIEDILNTIVLPDYEHVICGFEVKEPHERFDTLGNTPFQFMSVTIIFIGGPDTKLWPQTQGIQRMYDDILDEVWDVIYNYTNEGVDVYYKTVKDCGKKNIYLRESKQKSNYLNMIKNFVKSYKDRDYVCDVEVLYDEEDDYYVVTLFFDLNEIHKMYVSRDISDLRLELTRDVKNYIPIPNIYVGSSGRRGCGEKNINESMSDKNKINLVKKIIYDFDEVSFIKQSTYNDKPLLTVYFNSDDTAANIESWFTHQICDTVKDYTSGEIKCNPSWGPEWRTNRNNPDILIDAILLKYDDEGNVLNENWFKVPSSDYNSLEKVINLVMKEKYGWWKDIKINTLNYIDLYGDVQIEAELTVDEEWGANQWGEFYYNTKFPGNEGWEDNDGYSRRVSLGDITDSTYAEVIRDDLRDIFKYTLNIEVYIMSFRNVYLIFE